MKLKRHLYRLFFNDRIYCDSCKAKFVIVYSFKAVSLGVDSARFCPHCGSPL